MKTVPIYLSDGFEWKGKNGVAESSKLKDHIVGTREPIDAEYGIYVYSIKTGLVKYFSPVHDEDGYDGEYMVYSCEGRYFVNIWNY